MDQILSQPQQAQPQDPLTDLNTAVRGQPIAAFPGQDHDAHIAVKSAFLLDPSTGANPAMAKVQPLIEANIQEHLVMKFSEQVQGVAQQMNPQGPQQVIAMAAQQVLQYNLAQSQQVDDNAVEMAKIELKKKEIAANLVTKAAELTVKDHELDIRKEEAHIKMQNEINRDMASLHNTSEDRKQKREQAALQALAQLSISERQAEVSEKQIIAKRAEMASKGKKNG